MKLDKFDQQGMTLVEVLVALVILSLLTVSLLSVVTTSYVWVLKAGKSSAAMALANSIIEDIKANSSSINEGVYNLYMLNEKVDKGGLGLTLDYAYQQVWVDFDPEVIVEPFILDGNSSSNLKKVTVKVKWQIKDQEFYEIFTSIIAKR